MPLSSKRRATPIPLKGAWILALRAVPQGFHAPSRRFRAPRAPGAGAARLKCPELQHFPCVITSHPSAFQPNTQMTSPAFSTPREFLAELSEKFQVFRDHLPLAIGISQQLAGLYPQVEAKLLKTALFRHTNSVRYLKNMEKATQRHDLEGQATGEVTEEHRQHAATLLKERFKKQAEQRRAEAAAKKAEEDAKQAEAQRAAKLTALAEKFGRK